MTDLFLSIVGSSVSAGLVIALLLLLAPFLNRRYAAKWKYRAWIFLAIWMLIPFGISFGRFAETLLPQGINADMPRKQAGTAGEDSAPASARIIGLTEPRIVVGIPSRMAAPITPRPDAGGSAVTMLDLAAFAWMAGALAFFILHLASCLYYKKQVLKNGTAVTDPRILCRLSALGKELRIRRMVRAFTYEHAASPMIIGIFWRVLVLPKDPYTSEELHFILKHELVHLKRGDLYWKLLFMTAGAAHWFNPFAHIMQKEAAIDMEFSCDERVTQGMDYAIRRAYTQTLLAAAERQCAKKTFLSTQFYAGAKIMKKRFRNILNTKVKKNGILLLLCAAALTVCCGTLAGFRVIEGVPAAGSALSVDLSALAPDLNHNGIAENVRLTKLDGGTGQRLKIRENGKTLYSAEGYFPHVGYRSVFLCTLNGKDYLLDYSPMMFQGDCSYSYTLFSIGKNKKPQTVRTNSVEFDINFGSPSHKSFNAKKIASFMDEVNKLLAQSVLLLNTDNDLAGTFEKEGRLYDSVWWLDAWEPEFTRYKSKSLLENLKDFQNAMLKQAFVQLPATDPIDLVFASGAGAWGVALTLQPDGSFTADYSDADGATVYVCQYSGRFGSIKKLTDCSWQLTLAELSITTGRDIGETWDEKVNGNTIHYISSEPHGFTGKNEKALHPGAKFILYSPDAAGHAPGTELYGKKEFQSWMHERKKFKSADDTLGCWGLQNMQTNIGFFSPT